MKNILELKKDLEEVQGNDVLRQKIIADIETLKLRVERSIREANKDIQYGAREFTIEIILSKYNDGLETDTNELFIPDYQRAYKWDDKILSRFIESILMDFPIPYIYVADVGSEDDELDGRIEIIDGSQRIRALSVFVLNQVALTNLKEIKVLEGFYFKDLTAGRQRRFLRESLRFVELKGAVEESHRRDIFERINSGMKPLLGAESRHGSDFAVSEYYKQVIEGCAKNELFMKLAPLSDKKREGGDHRELVTRFFAFYHDMDRYDGKLGSFLESYLRDSEAKDQDIIDKDIEMFNAVMIFIDNNFNLGFRRTPGSKTTTRTRYDSLAVGAALALAENPNVIESVVPAGEWAFSDEYLSIINSDAANNKSNVEERSNYTKNKFLGL